MPIYEYQCRMCGERFESFRRMNDDDSEVECPVCGEENPQRVVSRVFGKGCSDGGNLSFPS
jgi:putative FmdB family regulatory protein